MKSALYVLLKIGVIAALVCGPVALVNSIHVNRAPAQTYGNFNPTGGGTYLLQSSISASQTSITLTSFTEPGSGIPYTMSYINTDVIYGTIAPSSGNSEFVSATGIVQNANGTATLTGVTRGLSRTPGTGGCVASSTLARAFPGQTQFILSNSPCFYSEYLPLRSNSTSTAIVAFSSTTPPRLDSPGVQATGSYIATTSEFASIAYVNNASFAGTVNATESVKGISQLATQAQMGSSTALGSSGASLVLQSQYASSSPSGVCGVCVVTTQGNGKITSSFINQAVTYAWTALHTFTGGLTSSAATTTIGASNISSNPFVANSLAYRFPPSRGASSTVLTENGSGGLLWTTQGDLPLAISGSLSTTNTSTTSVKAITIPANTLTATNMIRITLFCNAAGASGGPQGVQVDFGTGSATTSQFLCQSVTASTGGWASYTIIATSSTQANFGGFSYTDSNAAGSAKFATINTAANTYINVQARAGSGGGTMYVWQLLVELLTQ